MGFYLFVVLLIVQSVSAHSNDNHEDDHPAHLKDLRRLFVKYSNFTKSGSISLDQFETFSWALLGQLGAVFPLVSLDCYRNRTDDLKNRLARLNHTPHNDYLDEARFEKVGAFMLANLDRCFITANSTDVLDTDLNNPATPSLFDKIIKNVVNLSKEVWIFALVSVTVISVIGAVCVIIIPILNACCFTYLFQFLTALALGTLCGDALLHLIPHAFINHNDIAKLEFDYILGDDYDEHQTKLILKSFHQSGVFKGLAASVGVYMFFLVESLLKLRQAKIAKAILKNDSKKKPSESLRLVKLEPRKTSNAKRTVDESKLTTVNLTYISDDRNSNYDNMVDDVSGNVNKYVVNSSKPRQTSHSLNKGLEIEYRQNHGIKKPGVNQNFDDIDEYREIGVENGVFKRSDDDHGHSHHGHGHGHHHHHNHHKSSIFMIVIGDALHNFSDGLAIGASFAASITTGLGTTIAVFFHELPHEIGDFAVLRNNGLSLRRALFLNILSSLLCFIGVLIGLVIGSIHAFSTWSFLFIAGTFLYISLVDIIPELNESKKLANFSNFFIQNLGVLFGFGIMFLIALFESDIVKLIEQN